MNFKLIMGDTSRIRRLILTFNLCVWQKTLLFLFKHLSKQIVKVITQSTLSPMASCWVLLSFFNSHQPTKILCPRWPLFFTTFKTSWAKMVLCHEKLTAVSLRTKHLPMVPDAVWYLCIFWIIDFFFSFVKPDLLRESKRLKNKLKTLRKSRKSWTHSRA